MECGLFTDKIQPVSLFTETGFFIVLKSAEEKHEVN